jgi:hypothetical protein
MASEVTIRNKTAHVKHLALAGGEIISIPPTEEGMPGFKVTFDSEDEQKRFQQALKTSAVKAWIDSKELEVEGASASGDTSAPVTASSSVSGPTPTPGTPPTAPAQSEPAGPPGRGTGSRRSERE